jgi:hypothetical protein
VTPKLELSTKGRPPFHFLLFWNSFYLKRSKFNCY